MKEEIEEEISGMSGTPEVSGTSELSRTSEVSGTPGAAGTTEVSEVPEGSIRLAGVIRESIVDGPGMRFVLFCQGCSRDCPGCHNPQSHDPDGGKLYQIEEILRAIRKNPMIRGVTLSGGEPFDQALPLSVLSRRLCREGYDIWIYSGYTFEELFARAQEEPEVRGILQDAGVLIDGPFIQEQKSLNLLFRGSKNQRIIDLKASMQSGTAVEMQGYGRK